MMRFLALGSLLLTTLLLVGGCNTINGVGKDIEQGGVVIEDAAD